MATFFSRRLQAWYRQNQRALPWRETSDPYRIWLSEVILQQTQVKQGLSYYQAFVSRFPTINHLAAASEDEVLKLWQGLGYYSRARNLLAAARQVSGGLNGIFPSDHNEMKKLKGVGDYTAAAVASIAFGQPHAVVDGNVYRVLSRYFGIAEPVDSAAGKKLFAGIASRELDKSDPGTHNQAVMEFGALQCRPVNPDCGQCVLSRNCAAYASGLVGQLPVKSKKPTVRTRHLNYLVLADGEGRVKINRRGGKDIWQGLYEFDLHESPRRLSPEKFLALDRVREVCGASYRVRHVSPEYTHALTHQKLHTRFYVLQTSGVAPGAVAAEELQRYAFPVPIARFMQDCDLKEMF